MKSTSVPSNQKVTSKIVATGIYFTEERNIEVPQDAKTLNHGITSYIEEQGNMEIPVGNGTVKENGEMTLQNGNKLQLSQKDVKTLEKNKQERAKKNEKLAEIKAKEQSVELR